MLEVILKYRKQILNIVLFAAVVVLIYWALKWLLPFIVPLIIGIILALLMEPLVKFMNRRLGLPRWIASILSLLAVFGGLMTLVIVLSAKLVIELGQLAHNIPDYAQMVVDRFYGDIIRLVDLYYSNISPALQTKITENLASLGQAMGKAGASVANAALKGISSIPNLIVIILLALFISYFISKDLPLFKKKIGALMPTSVRKKGQVVYGDLTAAVGGYIRGQAILISITAVQSLIGLLILGVPYAFSLAVLAAFLDILPLLGTGTLFVPWAIFAFITKEFKLGIGLLIIYGLIVLVRQVMEPRILAGTIGLDPLAMIIVMYAGYTASGFIGLLLAPFILIGFQSLLKVRAFDKILGFDEKKGPPAAT